MLIFVSEKIGHYFYIYIYIDDGLVQHCSANALELL